MLNLKTLVGSVLLLCLVFFFVLYGTAGRSETVSYAQENKNISKWITIGNGIEPNNGSHHQQNWKKEGRFIKKVNTDTIKVEDNTVLAWVKTEYQTGLEKYARTEIDCYDHQANFEMIVYYFENSKGAIFNRYEAMLLKGKVDGESVESEANIICALGKTHTQK